MKRFITLLFIVFTFYGAALIAPTAAMATEETVWIAETGRRYHYENCRTLRGGRREITIHEARRQGYMPCGVCRRQPRRPPVAAESPRGGIRPNSIHAAHVTRIIDAGAIAVTFRGSARPERLHLIGVNTPETRRPHSREAYEFTRAFLLNSNVWVQFDVEVQDRFGRLLGYVWTQEPLNIDNEADIRHKMFNAYLLLEGYAQVMTIQPNSRYASLFAEFQREAREGNRGLWEQN